MKNSRVLRSCLGWFLSIVTISSLLFISPFAKADILLRNTTIKTNSDTTQVRLASSAEDGSLQILSFDSALTKEEIDQLKVNGFHPIRYIPDNSWICRVNYSESQTKVIPSSSEPSIFNKLQWSGEYKPEYRIAKAITNQPHWELSPEPLKIRVILAGDSSPENIQKICELIHTDKLPSLLKNSYYLQGKATGFELKKLLETPDILWVEPAGKLKIMGEVAAKIVEGENTDHFTWTQSLGYDGSGVIACVADTGLDTGDLNTLHPDLRDQVKAIYYYGDVNSGMDEHAHGTHLSGSIVANGLRGYGTTDENGYLYGLGTAPGAQLVAQRIIDKTGTLFLTEDFQLLARDAYRENVSVVNNSWGAENTGTYDSYAAEYDALVRDSDNLTPGNQEMTFIFAAGNSGPGSQTLITPGVGKNVITVGACQSGRQVLGLYAEGPEAMSDFSSRGPTEDGRYKPDIVAPGSWITSTRSKYASTGNEWLMIDENYNYMGGTSMSSPIVTGATAVIIQYFREMCGGQDPSPALLKSLLITIAQDMNNDYGTDYAPNYDEGWGRIWLPALIESTITNICENQSVLLQQDEIWERQFFVNDSSENLKITLSWTDVPGLPSAVPSLVNDLDLEVIDPNGKLYYGNQFLYGVSVTGSSPDRKNNVEGFLIKEPLSGMYTVRVRAHRIAEDARTDTNEIDQDFALVISGNITVNLDKNLICLRGNEPIPLPNHGLLVVDRTYYTAPDTIKISLYDSDLTATSTVQVNIASDSFPEGRNITLTAEGNSEKFSGTIQTVDQALGFSENELPLSDGDQIIISYVDSNPAVTITKTVFADLLPPIIEDPTSSFLFGKVSIFAEVNEPTMAILHFGLNSPNEYTYTNTVYGTYHEFNLTSLTPGEYSYFIEVIDLAGNQSINDNSDSFFKFNAGEVCNILLVDSFQNNSSGWFEITPLPLSGYTDCLDELGYQYDVWSYSEIGTLPLLKDLTSYNIVIWRANDLNYLDLTSSTIIPEEQLAAITEYVANGGNFFLSSMEILSYSSASFYQQVLHVQTFSEDTQVPSITGTPGTSIGNNISISLDYSDFPNLWILESDLSDTFVTTDDAAPIFFGPQGTVGVQYPANQNTDTDSGRVVFLSFPIDAIPMTGDSPNNRTEIFRRIIQFLLPGIDGHANIAFSEAAYSIPSSGILEIADSDLIHNSSIEAFIHTDTDNTPRSIILNQTVRPGVFQGTFYLSHATESISQEYLRAQNGDLIHAEYYDSTSGEQTVISASIDTIPPVLSDISIELDYMDGIISWTTDEPADSLIEFGESQNLSRTSYNGDYNTYHELQIPGLVPNKTYYFRISSRDLAKNTGYANEGELYTFSTPVPLNTPWFEDFETENDLWLVLNDNSVIDWGSYSQWERGTPSANISSIVPGPYQGSYCYGINLEGSASESAITALFSPAIYLEPGTTSTLSFMTAYDMLSVDDMVILNAGELSITTNNGIDWTTLLSFAEDSTFGQWEEVTVDLSKWTGNTIRLQWYYNFLSIFSSSYPGWFIDNVSITSLLPETSTIIVTNNLSAAQWNLSSSSSQTNWFGKGSQWTIELPADTDYTIAWDELPWYITPATQTRTLSKGDTISFEGIYLFNDSNANNISDEWELYFFDQLLSPIEATSDFDNDGLTNIDEFIAGTDPTNPDSNLELSIQVQNNKTALLSWYGIKGKQYLIQFSNDLQTWDLADTLRSDESGMTQFSIPISSQQSPIWYRLQVIP